MLKKALSLALSLALCLGLAVPALAAESPNINWLPEGVHAMLNPEIETLEPFCDGLLVVYSGTFTQEWKDWGEVKYGLVDKTGKAVVPVEYDSISFWPDGSIIADKNDVSYLIDQNGRASFLTTYNIQGAGEGLYTVNDFSWPDHTDDKYGFVDRTGSVVIPLEYDSAEDFKDGLAKVSKNEKYGFIDRTGTPVIPLEYDLAGDFQDGLAPVGKGNQQYYIDKSGKVVLSLGSAYQIADYFSEDLAAVMGWDGKMGAINRSGQLVIPMSYDVIYPFSEGLVVAGVHSGYEMDEYTGEYVQTCKLGLIDTTGRTVLPMEYDLLSECSGGPALAAKATGVDGDGYTTYKYGYVDNTGTIVIPLEYDDAYPFVNGQALVQKGDYRNGDLELNVIDTSGRKLIPAGYDFRYEYGKYGEPGAFFDGVAAVGKNGKWGYMDMSGKILLPLEYDEVSFASGGLGVVRQGSREGVVDLNAAPAPTTPTTPAGVQAMPTNDTLTCDGILQSPTVYKIDGSNYFKIRDLAAILNGTQKQFSVGYDGALGSVTAVTGAGYTRLPTDLTGAPSGGNKTAQLSSDTIYINGVKADAQVYKIDGSNYFKLRDLGKALNFYVGWSAERGMYILTAQPYGDEDSQTGGGQNENSQAAMASAMLAVLDRELDGSIGGARLTDVDGDGTKELLVLGVQGYLAYLYDWKDGQLTAKEVGADAGGPCIWWLFKDAATGELGVEYQSISEYEDTSTFYYAGHQAEIYHSFKEEDGFDYYVDSKKTGQLEYNAARGQRQRLEWLLGDKDYSPYSTTYREELLQKEFLTTEVRAELECLASGKSARDLPDETLWSIARRAIDEVDAMKVYLVSRGLLTCDLDNPIGAAVVLGDKDNHTNAYRVLHYTTIADAEKALRELWYHKFSSKYPSFDADFNRDCLAEYNGALYRIVYDMGFRPGYGVISKMVSRTGGEVIFSGRWTYGDEPGDTYDSFELSLVYEDGTWKYGYFKDGLD